MYYLFYLLEERGGIYHCDLLLFCCSLMRCPLLLHMRLRWCRIERRGLRLLELRKYYRNVMPLTTTGFRPALRRLNQTPSTKDSYVGMYTMCILILQPLSGSLQSPANDKENRFLRHVPSEVSA